MRSRPTASAPGLAPPTVRMSSRSTPTRYPVWIFCSTRPSARFTLNTDIASGWFRGPRPGTRTPSATVPSSASFEGTPYAGKVRPAVARLSGVTPGSSGYSNMPTLETHAVRSSADSATAKGCRPTRTDCRTTPRATSIVTSLKLN